MCIYASNATDIESLSFSSRRLIECQRIKVFARFIVRLLDVSHLRRQPNGKKRNDNAAIKATHLHKDSSGSIDYDNGFNNLFMGTEKKWENQTKIPKIKKNSADSMSSDVGAFVGTINSQHVFQSDCFSASRVARSICVCDCVRLRKHQRAETMEILHGELCTVFAFQFRGANFSLRVGNFKIWFSVRWALWHEIETRFELNYNCN